VSKGKGDVIIVIPTLNEEEGTGQVIGELRIDRGQGHMVCGEVEKFTAATCATTIPEVTGPSYLYSEN